MEEGKIIDFLDRKKQQGFTGCIKLAFEDGKLSHVIEANRLDLPMTKVFSQKAVLELVASAAENNFCGTVVFFCNRGEIEFYSYSRTYKGSELEAVLNENKEGEK